MNPTTLAKLMDELATPKRPAIRREYQDAAEKVLEATDGDEAKLYESWNDADLPFNALPICNRCVSQLASDLRCDHAIREEFSAAVGPEILATLAADPRIPSKPGLDLLLDPDSVEAFAEYQIAIRERLAQTQGKP